MAAAADTDKISIALKYAKSLVGVPYVWWKGGESTLGNIGPFYASDEKLPTKQEIMEQGCNCAGLVNLMVRKIGKVVPSVKEGHKLAGGTGRWWHEYKDVAIPFDTSKPYPRGTLLIRKYRTIKDQGHVAVIYDENPNGVLYSKLIHCYTSVEYDPTTCKDKSTSGVALDRAVGWSHFWVPEGYYTHAVLPKNWLV